MGGKRAALIVALIIAICLGWSGAASGDAICEDGTYSTSEGSGTCSWHGGVDSWVSNEADESQRSLASTPKDDSVSSIPEWVGTAVFFGWLPIGYVVFKLLVFIYDASDGLGTRLGDWWYRR